MHRLTTGSLLISLLAYACSGAPPAPRTRGGPADGRGASALGPSYILTPLPGEDEALLGRILHEPPAPGATLDEISRPNPCVAHLSPPKTTPLANRFEDAQEIVMGGHSRAILNSFGFSVSAQELSYFVYKLNTDKRLSRVDTVEYVECCKAKGCGYGFVSALIHGQGEYAVGSESVAEGDISVAVASTGGHMSLKFDKRRSVQGWIASVVTVTDPSKRQQLSSMKLAEQAGIQEDTLPQQMREIYDNNKISVAGRGQRYTFKLGSGENITENEFVRRYRGLTGSEDLDDIEARRNMKGTVLFGALTAISLSVLYYGVSNTERNCEAGEAWHEDACQANRGDEGAILDPTEITEEYYNPNAKVTNTTGYVFAILGGLATAGLGSIFIIKALDGDGGVHDHYLSDADARLYTGRYNRAFLRKTAREVRRTSYMPRPSAELTPLTVGQGAPGFGLSGRF